MRYSRSRLAILLLLLGACLLAPAGGVSAQPGGPPTVTPLAGGVRIEWRPAASLAASAPAGQPLVTIGGVRLPARLVALRVAGDGPLAPRVETLASVPWSGTALAAERPIPLAADGEPRAALAREADPALPATPVVVLREARLRGARVAVLAISPFFAGGGAARAVTELSATVPGATPLDRDAAALLTAQAGPLAAAPGPTNPAAGHGWKIAVKSAGIQILTSAALAAAGVPLSAPSLLGLYYAGQEVALDQVGAGSSLELRFYAPALGDRWNAGDTYWLVLGASPGLRMVRRDLAPAAAPATSAIESGVWRDNKLYDSYVPGPDGDHWYAADLKTGPGLNPATLGATLASALTPIVGTTVLTATGTAYTPGQHNLALTLGGAKQTTSWQGIGDWTAVFTYTTSSASAVVQLTPGSDPDDVELDAIAWRRMVKLDVSGKGAAFEGLSGLQPYQLANSSAGSTLYDVTDPLAPATLALPGGPGAAFEDGPAPRRYVLTGPGTLWAPAISRSQPYDFGTPAKVLYIAPAQLHAALAPLIARRQSQGYSVRAIDAQAIYDAWSYGQVSQDAIRGFLRYAAATWSPAPVAFTLVGDGTSDPRNYAGLGSVNYIPPYLAMVDPWMGETACDACYARLDGPDPTLDALPDLQFGRLPVKSAAELSALVSKIVKYETAPLDVGWRSRSVYIADDADKGGDFAAFADDSVAQQPAGLEVHRVYYDPRASGVPWREPDAVLAYQRAVAELSQGAGLVNYVGHGSPYQLATTDLSAKPPYLLNVYDAEDLANGDRLPIVLEMTCLTSAFQRPDVGGTIDERLLLNTHGGAIAVWGSTGQGVANGHEWLQHGFYTALWSAPRFGATVGQLAAGGYLELFSSGTCCQDALATYMLLGDPLTTARVAPARRVFLAAARR